MNIAIDTGIGAIPLLGDIFDVFYRSNKKNSTLFRKHADKIRNKFKTNPKLLAASEVKGQVALTHARLTGVLKSNNG